MSFTINSQQFRDNLNFEHTTYLGSESVNPFIINQIQIPLNTKAKPILSLSLKSNSGNTLIYNTILNNENGGFREIEFDAITEKYAFYFSYPLYKKFELFMEISMNSASGTGSNLPTNWMVRDNFIEKIHDVTGKPDLYGRKKIGFDNFSYATIDENNNASIIAQNEIFLIPLLMGINYYWLFSENEKKRISANATFSLKVPLKSQEAYKTMESGLGISINRTQKIRPNKSFTTSFHGSIYHHELLYNNDYIVGDKKMSYKLSGLLGFNILSKNNNRYSFFTTLNKTSSRLDSELYNIEGDKYNKLAFDAATKGNEYFEIGGNYAIHFKSKSILDIELTFREDLDIDINEIEGSLLGNNSEDFGVFIGFRYLIP